MIQMTIRQSNICRRLAVLAAVLVMTAVAAVAQNLYVDQAFARYGHAKGCKMVEMHNTRLKGYRLDVYKSLTYKMKYSIEVLTLLQADRKQAKKIREVVEDGVIVSGYYIMPPLANGRNRYVLFSNPDGHGGAVIYIEGRLSPDDIMKIVSPAR